MDIRAEVRAFLAEGKPQLRQKLWSLIFGSIPGLLWLLWGLRVEIALPVMILGAVAIPALIWLVLGHRKLATTTAQLVERLEATMPALRLEEVDARRSQMDAMAARVDYLIDLAADRESVVRQLEAEGRTERPMGYATVPAMLEQEILNWRQAVLSLLNEWGERGHPVDLQIGEPLPLDANGRGQVWHKERACFDEALAKIRDDVAQAK